MVAAGPVIAAFVGPETVNTVKAAEIAQVTVRTIYNWMRSGRIEYVRTAGNGVRIYVDSLFRDPVDE